MNKYHKRFLSSFAAENIIGLFSRYRNGAKEVTESWGMLEAAWKFQPDIDNCTIVVVGDGCSPRTGALFAYFTKANVISVDPNFNIDHWNEHFQKQSDMGYEPQRIVLIKDKIENIEIDCHGKNTLVLWPHSHANMLFLKIKNHLNVCDIALPCCVPIPKPLLRIPHITYEDINIASPKRIIHIWNENQRLKL